VSFIQQCPALTSFVFRVRFFQCDVRFPFVDVPAFHKLKAVLENIGQVEIIVDPKYKLYSDSKQ
jgi:hypothetical protein